MVSSETPLKDAKRIAAAKRGKLSRAFCWAASQRKIMLTVEGERSLGGNLARSCRGAALEVLWRRSRGRRADWRRWEKRNWVVRMVGMGETMVVVVVGLRLRLRLRYLGVGILIEGLWMRVVLTLVVLKSTNQSRQIEYNVRNSNKSKDHVKISGKQTLKKILHTPEIH